MTNEKINATVEEIMEYEALLDSEPATLRYCEGRGQIQIGDNGTENKKETSFHRSACHSAVH